jgi:hypothetical protein
LLQQPQHLADETASCAVDADLAADAAEVLAGEACRHDVGAARQCPHVADVGFDLGVGEPAPQHVHRGRRILDEQLGVMATGGHAELEAADAREQPGHPELGPLQRSHSNATA